MTKLSSSTMQDKGLYVISHTGRRLSGVDYLFLFSINIKSPFRLLIKIAKCIEPLINYLFILKIGLSWYIEHFSR